MKCLPYLILSVPTNKETLLPSMFLECANEREIVTSFLAIQTTKHLLFLGNENVNATDVLWVHNFCDGKH